jgi:TatA/E family protein of Tat protein translocase
MFDNQSRLTTIDGCDCYCAFAIVPADFAIGRPASFQSHRVKHSEPHAMAPLFGFFNSPYDWLVIALLAFLFFGNRLPTVMRSLGEGVTEFKKGMDGVEGDETVR